MKHNYKELSKVFSPRFLKRISASSQLPVVEAMKPFPELSNCIKKNDIKKMFEEAYLLLEKHYRNEYVFKSTIYDYIYNQADFEPGTDGLLTEVRSGESVVDLLWLNGTSTAIEIKSEIDSNERLLKQINDYVKLFNKIYVVTYSDNIGNIEKIVPNFVGILVLDIENQINTWREAEITMEYLDTEVMFRTLRRYEYEEITAKILDEEVSFSDADVYKKCLGIFNSIHPTTAHNLMVEQLKKREMHDKNQVPVISKALQFILETGKFQKKELNGLINKLQ